MHSRRQFLTTAASALAFPAAARALQERGTVLASLPPELAPARVTLAPAQLPGQIHVVPDDYALYWTQPFGEAIRYYVGVGRDSLYESGDFHIGAKKEWPAWTPTPSMIEREPEHYGKWKDGMPGGPGNPLGARALYLFTPTKGDTFLRIHGTDKPDTIRKDVSNGCARLVDEQIVDLYDRVPMDTFVRLYPKNSPTPFRVVGVGSSVGAEAPVSSVTTPDVNVAPLGGEDPLVDRLRGALQSLESGGLY